MAVNTPGISLPNTDTGQTVGQGIKFSMNSTMQLIRFTKDSGTTATTCYLKDSAGSTLATASFSGDVATFTPYTCTSGTTYRLEVSSGGSSYTSKRSNSTPGYPFVLTDITISQYSLNGADNGTTWLMNVISVEFQSPGASANPTFFGMGI